MFSRFTDSRISKLSGTGESGTLPADDRGLQREKCLYLYILSQRNSEMYVK